VGLLKAVEDPLGRVTRYTYDEFGQRIALTDNLDHTTYYAYDDLGRLYKTTYPTGLEDHTCYDAAGRMVRTASNVAAGVDACAAGYPETITSTLTRANDMVYDLSGNAMASTSWYYDQGAVISQTTRTYYDDANRPVTVVQNLSSDWGIANEEKPEPGYLDPLHNLRSDTVYDAAGNVIASIQWSIEGSTTLTHTTRTYYDALGRPWLVVQNLTGQSIQAGTPPEYDPAHPDQNVQSETVYDAAGNVVETIDNAGRVSYTCYDSLNRAVRHLMQETIAL
jgi:YD repeat-containing protein